MFSKDSKTENLLSYNSTLFGGITQNPNSQISNVNFQDISDISLFDKNKLETRSIIDSTNIILGKNNLAFHILRKSKSKNDQHTFLLYERLASIDLYVKSVVNISDYKQEPLKNLEVDLILDEERKQWFIATANNQDVPIIIPVELLTEVEIQKLIALQKTNLPQLKKLLSAEISQKDIHGDATLLEKIKKAMGDGKYLCFERYDLLIDESHQGKSKITATYTNILLDNIETQEDYYINAIEVLEKNKNEGGMQLGALEYCVGLSFSINKTEYQNMKSNIEKDMAEPPNYATSGGESSGLVRSSTNTQNNSVHCFTWCRKITHAHTNYRIPSLITDKLVVLPSLYLKHKKQEKKCSLM